MRKTFLKRCFATAVVTALALVGATGAFGANVTATATVTAGTLSLSTSATPSVSVTLDGTDQTPTYTLPMTIIDAGILSRVSSVSLSTIVLPSTANPSGDCGCEPVAMRNTSPVTWRVSVP